MSNYVQVQLEAEDWLELAFIAHEKDITLNALINEILRECINESHTTNTG